MERTGHVEVQDVILLHDIVYDLAASFVDDEDFPLGGGESALESSKASGTRRCGFSHHFPRSVEWCLG